MNFVLNIVAKSSIILFSAALLSLMLRRASASARHAIWFVALIISIALPLAALVVPQIEWPVLPEGTTTVTFLFVNGTEGTVGPSTTYMAATVWPAVTRWLQPAYLWMIGLVVLLLRLALGTLAVRRMENVTTMSEDQDWRDLLKSLCESLSLKKRVRLLFSDFQISPMTWGIRHHTILLPSSAAHWSRERRRLVLAHELAHVKRSDGIIQIAVQVVCSFYWFNPMVWYAARRVRIERERACDDQVLNLGTSPADYADHLVQIVRGLRAAHPLSLAAVSMAQPSQLETRLVSILDSRVARRGISKVAATCLCASAGILTLSIAAIGLTGAVPPPPVPMTAAVIASPPELPTPVPEPAKKPAATPQRTRIGDAAGIPNSTVVPPHVIDSKPPIYTDEAIDAGIEGTVTLELDVDTQGQIMILRVVKSLGYGLDERAIGVVLDWKFAPAIQNGVAVRAITQVDVDFRLPPPRKIKEAVVYRITRDVTPPTVISRVEPHYTEEARKARYQGTVVLEVLIKIDGTVEILRVVRGLDFNLDESAIEALKKWRFKPATRNGVPIDTSVNVEVNFNLR